MAKNYIYIWYHLGLIQSFIHPRYLVPDQRTETAGKCVKCGIVFLLFLWATSAAYGGSQARGLIGAVAAGLRQSHSNVGSEPHLQPTPQLMATPDC